jgi:hypothetical protein
MSQTVAPLQEDSVNSQERVLILGDSHVDVFKQRFSLKEFVLCRAGGATASGLENPNVKVKAHDRFLEAVRVERYEKVIICLGEVDTGFVIWCRVEKFGADLIVMLERTVSAYTRFLQKLAGLCGSLIVYSAPLPTIEDGNNWSEAANLRRDIKAIRVERTALTVRFNQMVEAFAGITIFPTSIWITRVWGENGIVKGLRNITVDR